MAGSDAAQIATTILTAIGAPAVLALLIKGMFDWISGRAGRERAYNTDQRKQREMAVIQRDKADAEARKAKEYASQLRGAMLELGETPPDWPEDLGRTIPRAELTKLTKPRRKNGTQNETD